MVSKKSKNIGARKNIVEEIGEWRRKCESKKKWKIGKVNCVKESSKEICWSQVKEGEGGKSQGKDVEWDVEYSYFKGVWWLVPICFTLRCV